MSHVNAICFFNKCLLPGNILRTFSAQSMPLEAATEKVANSPANMAVKQTTFPGEQDTLTAKCYSNHIAINSEPSFVHGIRKGTQ
ncbi:unnamed protein product [Brugia pahangi]|uniref:Uncharacterized protein n=1 Tax=Brugia pahangi TaxID=6280 RepID=A0A158PQL3_BRUPA|nr:unnamed protein product [Brugia pahangi]